MIPNAETWPKINLTGLLLSINGGSLKWCLNNKWINCICPTSSTVSIKPIKIPSAHIKPREDLDHYQVVTWALKWTRWIQTTDILITTELWYYWHVHIYQLPNIFSPWMYGDIDISCQNFVLFGYIVIKKLKIRVRLWERITK